MIKIKYFVLSILILLVLLVSSSFASSSDSIQILNPQNDEVLNGNISIIIYSNDDIQNTKISIYKQKCDLNGDFISDISINLQTSNSNKYIIDWDSYSSLLDSIALEDGEYCMIASNSLSQSKVSIIIDRNKNNIPTILNKQNNFIVKNGENFNLDIDAIDIDGEKLVYSIDDQNFKIDQNTGVISSENIKTGIYPLKVNISDGTNDVIFSVVINVSEEASVSPIELLIDKFYINKLNLVWKFNNKKYDVELSYSKDFENWKEVITIDNQLNEYTWDFNEIESGDYFIRATLKDQGATIYSNIYQTKLILSELSTTSIDRISITELNPQTGTTLSNEVSNVTGKFIIPDNYSVKEFTLVVNDSILVNNCSYDEIGFECALSIPMTQGVNKYVVNLVDNLGNQVTEEVNFNVELQNGNQTTTTTTNTSTSIFSIVLIVVVFCIMIFIAFKVFFKPLSAKDNTGKSKKSINKKSNLSKESSKENSVNELDLGSDEILEGIGRYDIGEKEVLTEEPDLIDDYIDSSPQDQKEDSTPISLDEPDEVDLPSSYLDDEEIPDWLKDVDGGSDPVGLEAEDIPKSDKLEGTQPFGMGPKTDDL